MKRTEGLETVRGRLRRTPRMGFGAWRLWPARRRVRCRRRVHPRL